MGKGKPTKKVAQTQPSLSKISKSFQRKSKTSQGAGQIDISHSPSKKSGKASATSTTPKGAQGKRRESVGTSKVSSSKTSTSKGSSRNDGSTTTNPKNTMKQQKKPGKKQTTAAISTKRKTKLEKEVSLSNKGNVKKGKTTRNSAAIPMKGTKGKVASVKKRFSSSSSSASSSSSSEGEKTTRTNIAVRRVAPKQKSRDSREETLSSPSTRLRSPDTEKVTTRKRSKSDSESPPPQKVAKAREKGRKTVEIKKTAVQRKSSAASSAKDVAKKATKKAVAAVVVSKKKTVVRKSRSSASPSSRSSVSSSSSSKAKDSQLPVKHKKEKKVETKTTGKSIKVAKIKPKAKPKAKVKAKRMASLNAKAILEASFSFEQSEKKQRSPAPQGSSASTPVITPQPKSTASTSTSTDELPSYSATSGTDGKESLSTSTSTTLTASNTSNSSTSTHTNTQPGHVSSSKLHVTVSTSTSPTPPEVPESLPPTTLKTSPVSVKGEKKQQRKSTDTNSDSALPVRSRKEGASGTKSSSKSIKDVQTPKFVSSSTQISPETSPQMRKDIAAETVAENEKSVKVSEGKAGSKRSGNTQRTSSVYTHPTSKSPTEVATSMGKNKEKSAVKQQKKKKIIAPTTIMSASTSTSTSPLPVWSECDVEVGAKCTLSPTTTSVVPKQKKSRNNSIGGRDKTQQDASTSSPQLSSYHHTASSGSSSKQKSVGYKEKPLTSVSTYDPGTVYQPAGPLIEPHKQSSVHAGLLPETVRLPADLKVTYQTHPPSSAFMISPHEAHHQHSSSTNKSGGSSKSHKSSHSGALHKSSEKSSSSSSSAGTILHQPYKSSPCSSSSPTPSRKIPSTFSSAGSGYTSSTGTPLLSPNDVTAGCTLLSHHHHNSPSSASVGVSVMQGSQLGSSGAVTNTGSVSLSSHHHPLHSVTPGGSINIGGSSQQPQNPGAPSSGLFYTTNYVPHNSPFAPCKFPIVPPESYRTPSPFPNSFLCPPATPQPSQSYFMTPFYTPPLTPNPTPGVATVGANQPRPMALSSAAGHHPSTAAAYYQPGPLPQTHAAAHLPTSYYLPTPQHHSIHPSAAPGHAGPFRPNQSSQPACPCPTESCPPNSSYTNNNTKPPPLQQRPYLSSDSLPVPGVGANKPHKPKSSTSPVLVSVTATRPSRNSNETHLQHPPACITPAVAADPPTAIQIVPSSVGDYHHHTAQDAQTRQKLESAKTFTEQYSLPDDITITPIMPPNNPIASNPALLMLNSSVSVILTSAPSSSTTTITTSTGKSASGINHHDGLLRSNNFNVLSKPKEKDIVHVIDPRSGERTTIAKHISNNSRNVANLATVTKTTKFGKESGKHSLMNRTSSSRMETVRKLNPDLDVIVINNFGDKTENLQTMHRTANHNAVTTPTPDSPEKQLLRKNNMQGGTLRKQSNVRTGAGVKMNKTLPALFSTISSSVMGISPSSSIHNSLQHGKRMALSHNDNNSHRNNNETGGNSILRVNQKRSKHPGSRNPVSNFHQHNSSFTQATSPSSSDNVRSPPPSASSFRSYTVPVLPPGISISAGNSRVSDGMMPTNFSKKNHGGVPMEHRKPASGQSINQSFPHQKNIKAIKRSLNECIDGLQLQYQQKKLKLLDQQHAVTGSSGNSRSHNFGNGSTSARTGIFNVNGGKPVFSGAAISLASQHRQHPALHQAQFRQQVTAGKFAKSRQSLQSPAFRHETATAARVRGPDFEQKLGGMMISSSDATTAVSALVVEPLDYKMTGRHILYSGNSAHGLGKRNKDKVVNRHNMGSYAYAEAKMKVSKLKGRHTVTEKASNNRGGTGFKSKIRTRLSVRPKGIHNSQQPLGSRSRSRLLRKRSLLCNPNSHNSGGNRRSESDGSVCASRSSSSVRIISGAGGQQNGTKVGVKEREKEKPRHTQAFINVTADLYQYRRRMILRVPSPKPVVPLVGSMATTAVSNLNRTISIGADTIARFGDMSPSSSSLETSSPSSPSSSVVDRTEIPRELAVHQMAQLARSHILGNQHQLLPVASQQLAMQESKGPSSVPLPRTGSMVVNALKKRAGMKPLSPASVNGALNQQLLFSKRQPRWSNGWTFEGEPYEAKVYVKNDDTPVTRRCYPSMRHDGGDVIRTRDCVLLKSGPRKNDLPFIAKIAALWENPTDGEMMFSLLWYYRPEHTELGRTKDDMMDEIFASKHRDTNSVATIEDRCYVLTFNEYCRYRKRLKQLEQGIQSARMVPFADTAMANPDSAAKIADAVWNGISADPSKSMGQGKVCPEVVFFCRKVYDFRQKRILKNPS